MFIYRSFGFHYLNGDFVSAERIWGARPGLIFIDRREVISFFEIKTFFICHMHSSQVSTSVACVASVSVRFRSKERPRKGIFDFDRARNETWDKNWKTKTERGALLLAPFFVRSLTLVPRSSLLNPTETLATQATTSGVLRFYRL